MATCTLHQMYFYNMWYVVAGQGQHVTADQPKCHARLIVNVKHIDQFDNSEQDCDEEGDSPTED